MPSVPHGTSSGERTRTRTGKASARLDRPDRSVVRVKDRTFWNNVGYPEASQDGRTVARNRRVLR
jgi:hypothetical protein